MNKPELEWESGGSIPTLCESPLVPLNFQPDATDPAPRLASRSLERVLEIAAGTGVVTRSPVEVLPEAGSIVATDRNQSMIDQAAAIGTRRPVGWRPESRTTSMPRVVLRERCRLDSPVGTMPWPAISAKTIP